MAIYFPKLFCGRGTTLKARKDFEIYFEDEKTMTISAGEKCTVTDIIGYGYNIKKCSTDKEVRIMNGLMQDYFDILDKVEPENGLDSFNRKDSEAEVVCLQKDFEIKDVIKIPEGHQFLHFIETTGNGIFHDLFSIDDKARTLRMKDSEFEKYFKK